MRTGAIVVPIVPTTVAPTLSAWDLLSGLESAAPSLSAWDLLPASGTGSVRPRLGFLWAVLAGLGMLAALVRQALAAEVPYLAQRGETLRQIASRLWDRPEAWRSLWRQNRDRVRNPGFLPEGTVLRLPDQLGAPGPLPPNPVTVRSGDTLWDLAGRIYGDSWAWPLLWGANRDRIRDPHWIYPQQRFRWPSRGTLHVVQQGETLSAVARRYYGDGAAWPRLWAANRGWLSRPERLPLGGRLWVPRSS
jgi:nucleoid-associated protein YgaU